jgi:glycosyltransferase involved in cell wall biosynthesis
MNLTHHQSPAQICLVPRLEGLGGMVSFQAKLVNGLVKLGLQVTYDLNDPASAAVLVIGGTRRLGAVWRARRRGTRIVQRLDGMNWLHRKQRTPLSAYLRAEGNNLLLAFIRRFLANAIVYQSQFSHDWWQQAYRNLPTPCRVVYNGVDLGLYSPLGSHQRPADHFRILLVEGHLGLGNIQGLENALGLATRLQQDHHLPVELAVVGDVSPQLRAAIEARALQAMAGSPVSWSGILRREEIPLADRSAHLLFSADLNAACPNSVIEAMACGLPVVSFDTGALRELVTGDAGRVAPYGSNHWELEPPDLAPLAQAAAEILADNERFRAAARERAEAAFSLDQMVEGYLEALLN